MIYYVNFYLSNFVLDFLTAVLAKKLFKLSVKNAELIFLQIFGIAVSSIYLFCGISFHWFFVLKILAGAIVCLLITDSFRLLDVLKLEFFFSLIGFSVYGFFEFLNLFLKAVFFELFGVEIDSYLNFCVHICFAFYYALLFWFFGKLSKEKFYKKHLTKVSFYLFGKHIKVVGLIDSGNSLKDTKTGKSVIIVSINALKKHFEGIEYDSLLKTGFCRRTISCEVAGGSRFEMPIVNIGNACVGCENETKIFDCVLGIVDQKFCDEKKYDCLVSRDFF